MLNYTSEELTGYLHCEYPGRWDLPLSTLGYGRVAGILNSPAQKAIPDFFHMQIFCPRINALFQINSLLQNQLSNMSHLPQITSLCR